MDFSTFFIYFGVLAFCLHGCIGQKFDFKEPISYAITDVWNGQSGNWSVKGGIQLTKTDTILFEQKVSIQTCNQVCEVDLKKCPPDNVPDDQDACYCTQKNGDMHLIHVGSKATDSQSGTRLTATIKSHDMFQPITAITLIGTLPKTAGTYIKHDVTYRVNEGPDEKLQPQQQISVCEGSYVNIRICVPMKNREAILKIGIHGGQTILSEDTCVNLVEKYTFDKVPIYRLGFSYLESKSYPGIDVSKLFVQKGNECKPSISKPVQVKPTQPPFSKLLSQTVSSFSDVMKSLKLELDNAAAAINDNSLQLKNDHKDLRNQLHGISTVINITSSRLSTLQSDHNQILKLMVELESSLEASLENKHFDTIQQNFDNISLTVDSVVDILKETQKDKYLCSEGNGCVIKQTISGRFQCYTTFLNKSVTWYEAVERCQAIGGFLAEIPDKQSLDYIKTFVSQLPNKELNENRDIWIGGTDEGQEGVWRWTTSGNRVSLTNWGDKQPDNSKNIEDCLEIKRAFSNLKWNDDLCTAKQGYICQKVGDSCNGWM